MEKNILKTVIADNQIEKQYLEDLYSLSANTDSLAAMLLAQKEKKESFDQMMKEKEETFGNTAKRISFTGRKDNERWRQSDCFFRTKRKMVRQTNYWKRDK